MLSQPITVEGKPCSVPEYAAQNHLKGFCGYMSASDRAGISTQIPLTQWDDFQAAEKMCNKEAYEIDN